jgi:hypothetical protein
MQRVSLLLVASLWVSQAKLGFHYVQQQLSCSTAVAVAFSSFVTLPPCMQRVWLLPVSPLGYAKLSLRAAAAQLQHSSSSSSGTLCISEPVTMYAKCLFTHKSRNGSTNLFLFTAGGLPKGIPANVGL